MFTCAIRYVVDLDKLDDFRDYATAWIALITKYGGTHHGYFIPGDPDTMPKASFSFPGLGSDGASDVALALFSFDSVEAYERYRDRVAGDPECRAATARFDQTKPFLSYQRHFLEPVFS